MSYVYYSRIRGNNYRFLLPPILNIPLFLKVLVITKTPTTSVDAYEHIGLSNGLLFKIRSPHKECLDVLPLILVLFMEINLVFLYSGRQ